MAVIRLFSLLVVLGGLSLLLAQNLSPALSLVFLGMRTPALPLALWILICLGSGALTTLLVASLFQVSNYFARLVGQKNPLFSNEANRTAKRSEPASSRHTPPPNTSQSSRQDDADDWNEENTDDDWEFEETADTPASRESSVSGRDYERPQEPKSGSKSGSSYSYSYKEPQNSGVGKTESVYDADFRVLTPPYKPPVAQPEEEDWGFEDEDDVEDDKPKRKRS